MTADRSLAHILHYLETIGTESREIAAQLARVKNAPHELAATLARFERILGDFGLGIAHALDALTPATRAEIAKR